MGGRLQKSNSFRRLAFLTKSLYKSLLRISYRIESVSKYNKEQSKCFM